MIIATLIGCLKKLATKCAASVREVNTRDQKYSVSRGFLKDLSRAASLKKSP
ncbi:hypothetical protein WA845_04350 [Agrobacterium sp. CMT1]|jgi:hypothetical protein|uniref:hypothetical protein n=1 Tax=Agrobacterium sp. CMT1 TaxID=3128901 RepID=UPI0013AFDD8F